jgi:hypothetical protein
MVADRVDAISFDISGLDPQNFSFSEIVEHSSRIAYADVSLAAVTP